MFLQYTIKLFYCPHIVFRALLEDRRRLVFGVLGILVLAVVYFLGISIVLKFDVMHQPQLLALNIPPEHYYAYERYFIFPVGLAGTILAAGVIRLSACGWKGKGRFEDLFALFAFSMIVVAVLIGLPDLVIGILTGLDVITPLGFAYVGPHVWLGTLWYLFLSILAVKETEHLAWGKSLVLGLIGFATNGVIQFIFIR
jgi:hypothetical protein